MTPPGDGYGARVWETWKGASEVYLPGGRTPPRWEAEGPIPAGCRGVSKLLPRVAKVDDVATLNGDVQAALAELGSVFASYELVGTRWARPPHGGGEPGGGVRRVSGRRGVA